MRFVSESASEDQEDAEVEAELFRHYAVANALYIIPRVMQRQCDIGA